MVPIARRQLLEDKLRLGISVGGVALSLMLVLLLGGFLNGMNRQITSYVDNSPAEFYVAQKGDANFLGAGSIIPRDTLGRVQSVEGAKSAIPIFSQYSILDLHGKKVASLLIGYDPAYGGGPWKLNSGRMLASTDEIVMDRVLASQHGLGVGETISILGKQFRIVGLSEGTTSWMVRIIFMRHDVATSLLRVADATSFVLVSTNGDPSVGQRLKSSLPEFSVVDRDTIAKNDANLLGGVFSLPLRMMVLIAIGIGALLVGLTMYSATVERVREYGVLKSLGMSNRALYSVVVRQAISAAALGFVVGLLLVMLVAAGIERIWPQFLVVVDLRSILQAIGGVLVIAFLAAFAPARYVARIDPASIFRR